jgi:pyrophosphate--fructose-6-phosphate 1-phosphotransferase
MVDARSALKYWHIVKLMGRSASHVTLEVALRTEPHLALISEEMENRSLHDVIEEIADLVIERAKRGTPYGVIVVPEGLLEFLPDLRGLFTELARAVPTGEASKSAVASDAALGMLSPQARSLFTSLPDYVQRTLLASRDEHGNLTVSQLETDRFLADLVEARLKEKSPTTPFSPITHFYGYEGRCGPPSLFDLRLGYFLGLNAGAVALNGATGYLASYTGLGPFSPVALPLIGMLHQELRHGERTFVIKKSLVDTSSPAFRAFTERRGAWRTQPSSPVVLPVQYSGDLSERVPMSVALNRG